MTASTKFGFPTYRASLANHVGAVCVNGTTRNRKDGILAFFVAYLH